MRDTVESLTNRGVIVIVLIPGQMTTPITWRCVVLDESENQDIVYLKDVGHLKDVGYLKPLGGAIRVEVGSTRRASRSQSRTS